MAKYRPPPFEPEPDRPVDFPFSEFDLALEAAVHHLRSQRIRHAARNAFVHIRKAWTLHPIDSEMSLFCAITAEEEAATALIRALRLRKYPGASLLQPRSHAHKSAIWPVIAAVREGMRERKIIAPELGLSTKGPPRVELSVDFDKLVGAGKGNARAVLKEPLELVIRSDKGGPMKVETFASELDKLAKAAGADGIQGHIFAEANLRNRVLYASGAGVPAVTFHDDALKVRAFRVTAILIVVVAVLQTMRIQSFVVQCLEGLLVALELSAGLGYDYPESADDGRPFLQFTQQPDGWMKPSVVARDRIQTHWGLRWSAWPGSWT